MIPFACGVSRKRSDLLVKVAESQFITKSKVQGFINEGYRFVVDLDLEKFFERVNHDIPMGQMQSKSMIFRNCGRSKYSRMPESWRGAGLPDG